MHFAPVYARNAAWNCSVATPLIIVVALLLDRLLGEPARWHPLVGFGRYAHRLEHAFRRGGKTMQKSGGVFAWALAILPPTFLALWLEHYVSDVTIGVIALYFAIGWRSLEEHAQGVAHALRSGDLTAARGAVGLIVSRDTNSLSEDDVAKATVESVLENGNDALFGALFWFFVLGAPGVVLYRLANTLDAMWGYKSARYLHFGWAAARLDDALNYVPARFTALSYSLAGQTRQALACWLRQGLHWKSPNAGPVMASGAGSMGVEVGGAAVYDGQSQPRPVLGVGRPATVRDIDGAISLLRRALMLWLCAAAVIYTLVYAVG